MHSKNNKYMQAEKQYIDLYRNCGEAICSHSCAPMNAVREAAAEAFEQSGLATRKVEEYKYTNLQDLFAPDYGVNINRLHIPANPNDVFKCDVPNLSTLLYFVVNDQPYNTTDARRPALPEGVIIDSICNVASKNPGFIEKYYGHLAAKHLHGEVALNTMLAQDGLLVYVPKGVCVEKTVQVVNILRSDVDLMVNRRVLIIVEEGAEIKLLFCDHAADDKRFLATQVTECFVGDNASLEIYCMEETHVNSVLVSNTFIEQQRSSRVRHNAITLHNGITRNTLKVNLQGEGAECWLDGCVIADKKQHIDNNTLITHNAQHCDSHELYKYVIDEESVGAFAGKVLVPQDAQKTTSEMTNQNLCGSKTARMYTQPMLEIYADDVKCSHGSTVGQLNDQAMFYMRQRGISLEEARMLLQTAFIYEVVDRIALAPLRERLHYLVDKRFRGELNKCEGCKMCK